MPGRAKHLWLNTAVRNVLSIRRRPRVQPTGLKQPDALRRHRRVVNSTVAVPEAWPARWRRCSPCLSWCATSSDAATSGRNLRCDRSDDGGKFGDRGVDCELKSCAIVQGCLVQHVIGPSQMLRRLTDRAADLGQGGRWRRRAIVVIDQLGVLSRNRRKFRQPINVACPAPGRWGRPNSRVTSRHFDHGNASRTSRPDCSGLDEAD